uniref:Uncharacterized protein n=1 Tax=viral metagenome TaxID=1070528 RepID=A0A6M3JBV5_9ZZZZ
MYAYMSYSFRARMERFYSYPRQADPARPIAGFERRNNVKENTNQKGKKYITDRY